ncbi:MAG: M48 family metalloprotease [Gammaproteobacteria bacterium]
MPLNPRVLQKCRRLARPGIVALVLTLPSFAASPSTELPSLGENSAINIERETRLGHSVYAKLLAKGYIETDPLLDRYINDLGFRLLAGLDNRVRDYRFFIIRDDAVNAFALPGGYIGVNRGLIREARTQHQLASVLAHEIAHVRLRHGIDMMEKGKGLNTAAILAMLAGLLIGTADSEVGQAVLFGGLAGTQQAMINYTRENEYEADRLGMQLMYGGQFDPNGMVEFFTIMTQLSGTSEIGNIEYLRTHPVGVNRIAEAAGRVNNNARGGNQVDDYPLFKDYLQFVSSDHLPDSGSQFLRALASIQAGEYQRADTLLGSLYSRDNENIWYSIAFAVNLEHLEREAEAELVYRRLLDIFPGDYILSMRLLGLLKLAGRYQSALVIARRLEIEFPENQQVYFELSEIYQSLHRPALQMMAEAEFHRITGNRQQAIKLYDQVLVSSDADHATESKAREKRLLLLER